MSSPAVQEQKKDANDVTIHALLDRKGKIKLTKKGLPNLSFIRREDKDGNRLCTDGHIDLRSQTAKANLVKARASRWKHKVLEKQIVKDEIEKRIEQAVREALQEQAKRDASQPKVIYMVQEPKKEDPVPKSDPALDAEILQYRKNIMQ